MKPKTERWRITPKGLLVGILQDELRLSLLDVEPIAERISVEVFPMVLARSKEGEK